MRFTLTAAMLLASSAMPAFAQDAIPAPAPRDDQDNSFRLGEIIVTGTRPQGVEIGSESVGQEARVATRWLPATTSWRVPSG